MKVFINWFINCSCCIWFFTMASSAPVSFSPWLWRVSTVSWERADSSSSCSFRGALEVLAHFLSSLCLLFLSLFLFWPNIAKDCSNCAPNWSCLCPFLCGFSQNLKNARKCLAWILHHNWRSRCLFTPEQNLFCCRMVRFFCCLLSGYDYDLCLFIAILEIFAFPLALGTCHIPSFRYFFSYFLPQLPGMPCL